MPDDFKALVVAAMAVLPIAARRRSVAFTLAIWRLQAGGDLALSGEQKNLSPETGERVVAAGT